MVPTTSTTCSKIKGPLDGDTLRNVPVRNYDVFLNHRGPDVKKTLVSHLSAAFSNVNFTSFVDDPDILPGDLARETIKCAIHHSKLHIAVFSPSYAHSSWCLDELRLIIDCFNKGSSHLFLPVFFNVTPSDLRLQTPSRQSCYNSAFEEHRSKYEATTINNWKKALHDASMVKGYIFPDAFQGNEAWLVHSIVSKVIEVLSRATLLHGPDHPVGVDEKLREALGLMEKGKSKTGVQKFGIYGMGGMGKTTLAKSIYNRIHREFESACFMQSVSECGKDASKGLKGLQKEMLQELLKTYEISVPNTARGKQMMRDRLHGKKVLIILDDVSEKEHLDELMPPHDCHLGKDSQIVITTRDGQVLNWAQAQTCLRMEGLSRPLACDLFNLHAFPFPEDLKKLQEEPSGDLKKLAEKVADTCKGLPLALVLLGSYLQGKDISEWEATVKVLETRIKLVDPQRKVTAILKITFDALGSEEQKQMFLDIACFLLQEPKDKGMRIWRSEYGDAEAELHLENLIRKCLVKLDKNGELTMHDLLRDMGREIAENSHKNYWKRSHLWKEEDVYGVLQTRKGTSHVRGLSSNVPKEWQTKSFAGMDELKLLVLNNVSLTGDFSKISKKLRWFQLRYCPLTNPLPLNEICLDAVAVLDLKGSKLTSFNCVDCMLQNLKELNLSNCSNLKELPVEFCKNSSSLEILILSGCVNLKRMPDSISDLCSSLRYLDVSGCYMLTTLPHGITNLRVLTTLLMNNCGGLTKLPDAIGQLTALENIGLDWVPLSTLPQSFGSLSSLVSLRLYHSFKLMELPSTIGELRKLTSLDIISCPLISEIPPGVTKLANLVHFRVSDCESVSELPKSIKNLRGLVELHVHDLVNLFYLPSTIRELRNLRILNLKGCPNLCEVQGLPQSLTSLDVGGCASLEYLDLDFCCNLKALPSGMESLRSLTTLHVNYGFGITSFPEAIGQLITLTEIRLHGVSLSTLPQSFSDLSNLVSLDLSDCRKLRGLPSTMGNLKQLTSLDILKCPLISEIPQGLTNLTNLERFTVLESESMKQLPENIWNLWNLKVFKVDFFNMKLSVSHISQLEQLPNLESLGLKRCPNLSEICLSSLTKLRSLELSNCTQLVEIYGLECLDLLSYLDITGCKSLLALPSGQLEKLTSLEYLYSAGSGVSILQDNRSPWIQKMGSLKVASIKGDEVPDCFKELAQGVHSLEISPNIIDPTRMPSMKMAVPVEIAACRGVLCCFVLTRHPGNLSYVPVTASVVGREGRKFSDRLFRVDDSDCTSTYICIYRASHPFVACLQGGDEISMDVWSYPRRVDVTAAVVKLIYGKNEMQHTLQRLSLVNKPHQSTGKAKAQG